MTARFSSPSECYSIFVGDTCSPSEFMRPYNDEIGSVDVSKAVELYLNRDWPWDGEQPTDEIKDALVSYLSDEIESDD